MSSFYPCTSRDRHSTKSLTSASKCDKHNAIIFMNISKEQLKNVAIHSFAVVGFVVVLGAGVWGSVQVARYAPSALSSLAAVATSLSSVFTPAESLTLNTPAAAIPTDAVYTLTWEHAGAQDNGSYEFSYTCRDGLSFQTPNAGGIYEELSCDTPFRFSSENNSLLFIPLLSGAQFVTAPVTLSALTETGDRAVSTETTLTIGKTTTPGEKNDTVQPLVPGEETSGTYSITDSRTTSDPSGRPDLSVRIIGVGIVDEDGVFTPTDALAAAEDRGAVRFEIANVGTRSTGEWTFNAVLPTFPMHIFHSDTQQALQPGDRIVFTLEFNQLNSANTDSGVVTINADPTRSIGEISEENNIKQFTVVFTK